MSESLIVAKNLYKFFDRPVLKGVSLKAKEGQVTAILGSSGSGKSTLLRCLNLLEMPDAGDVFINGEQIEIVQKKDRRVIANPGQISRLRATMPMVFQHFNLWAHLTCLENVVTPMTLVLKRPHAQARNQALEFLQQVGLVEHAHHFPEQLSGGQKQRVAIARALAMEPRIILFDEPTSALDPEKANEVLEVIKNLAKKRCTMLVVTHIVSFAQAVADRVIFLNNGVVESEGDADEIFSGSGTKRLQEFLKHIK